MTKREFEAFALIVKAKLEGYKESPCEATFAHQYIPAIAIQGAVINVAKVTSPRFNEDKFRKACQPD